MREIIRSTHNSLQQYAAIDWQNDDLFNYTILLLQNEDNQDEILFNNNIEMLYKKWLIGDEVQITANSKSIQWNLNEQFIPTFLCQIEKNEYLAKKAQKHIQQYFSNKNAETFNTEADVLLGQLSNDTPFEIINEIAEKAKVLDEKIRIAVQRTKNISLAQKWITDGILNEAYLPLKSTVNSLFDKIKNIKNDAHHHNYNLMAPKVEAIYALSKHTTNYNDTRKEIIAIQKEVIATQLERWQKNELLDRIRSAFDHINTKQDSYRQIEDAKRLEQTDDLQKQYDLIIPQALNTSFNEGFTLLKDLQERTNKTSIVREKRDDFYNKLDEAFNTIKQKADAENAANYEIANKQVDLAIDISKQTDLFKEARQILITAQNELKEIRLAKKQKDELFTKLRAAFDELNQEQDNYFKEKRKENIGRLEEALRNLKRIVARKKEGIEVLYNSKSNAESKSLIIKVDKKSDGTVANQFKQKVIELTAKIEGAEKDIAQLEKKIEKMEVELNEIKQ